MSLAHILAQKPSKNIKFDLSLKALNSWNPDIKASSESGNVINILDQIGEDYWGDGITSKSIARQLSYFDGGDVTVNINSPGGDVFEGLAIYSLLKEYSGSVEVKVIGLAASAASIIAMAGDTIKISRAGFFMIHNAWMVAAGNRLEFAQYADFLKPIDSAMADIYQVETGLEASDIESMMDAETWIGGKESVDKGFSDSLLDSSETVEASSNNNANAIRKLDLALAKACIPRSERRKMLAEFKSSMQDATIDDKQDAVNLNVEPLARIEFNFKLDN